MRDLIFNATMTALSTVLLNDKYQWRFTMRNLAETCFWVLVAVTSIYATGNVVSYFINTVICQVGL